MDDVVESGRPQTAFREKHRANPALIGAAVGISAFFLGLALLPHPSADIARFDGPEVVEMTAPVPAAQVSSAPAAEFRLAPPTGVFEEGPLQVNYEVWG